MLRLLGYPVSFQDQVDFGRPQICKLDSHQIALQSAGSLSNSKHITAQGRKNVSILEC